MNILANAAAVMGASFLAGAMTSASAGDMTFERSLNVGKEPQNWLLHHGNYEGYRFSQLKDINTDTIKILSRSSASLLVDTKAVEGTSSAISRLPQSSKMA